MVTVPPFVVTRPLVAEMVAAIPPLVLSWIVMFPAWGWTSSVKVRTMSVSTATPVAPFAGLVVANCGATVSAVEKFSVVGAAIPANALPAVSVTAVAATVT